MSEKYWGITSVFEGLAEYIVDWIERYSTTSSVLLNLGEWDIYGDSKIYNSAETLGWLGSLIGNNESCGIHIIGKYTPNPKFEIFYLSPYRINNSMSSQETEVLGKTLFKKSHLFFTIFKQCGYEITIIKRFPKQWNIKSLRLGKTVTELKKRKEYLLQDPETPPNLKYFWAISGSYKKLFHIEAKYYPLLLNETNKIGIKVKEI